MSSSSAPSHRISTERPARHVVVTVAGTAVAASDRPVVLHETGCPPRYYLPPEDVDFRFLEPTDTHTTCPFKGVADYWAFTGSHASSPAALPDIAWAYPDPLPGVDEIRGHLAFYNEAVEITVDGAPA